MGAGDRQDHHVQDSAEAYLVWQLQLAAESNGRALSQNANALKADFDSYVDIRNARQSFDTSEYKANVDTVVRPLFEALANAFPSENFDFVDVEKENRDLKKKGDLEIRFGTRPPVSVSVKNYKKGFKRIQLCSGTWNSFLNNFLFTPVGVGTFLDPRDGAVFSGSNRQLRDEIIRYLGLDPLIAVYQFIDQTNDAVRDFYVRDSAAAMWAPIATRWKQDCVRFGTEAANQLTDALNGIEPRLVKRRLLVMAGLNFDEELLLMGQGLFLCSLVNKKYRDLLTEVNDDQASVQVTSRAQTMKLTIHAKEGRELAAVDVPFTLQKNGAWHLPKVSYKGTEFHLKEGIELAYGQRRPKKSKELATSTNTYLDLGRLGLP